MLRVLIALFLFQIVPVAEAHPVDFSGIWERYPDPFEGGLDYPPPPGGVPPLKKPYASAWETFIKKRDEAHKAGEPLVDASTRCVPEGMPTIMGGIYAIEIMQSHDQLAVLAEFLTQTRRIYINESMPPLEEIFPSYNGHSVGHWEGDTLVINTVGIREDVEFINMPHSESMRITERIRLVSPDRLENQIRIEDSAFLNKPYDFTFGYRRLKDYRIIEHICDNNRWQVEEDGKLRMNVDP